MQVASITKDAQMKVKLIDFLDRQLVRDAAGQKKNVVCFIPGAHLPILFLLSTFWAQLFKTKDVLSWRFVKFQTLISKICQYFWWKNRL